MSRGNDRKTEQERTGRAQSDRRHRSARSSMQMTVERARAIQSHADRTDSNQDFKARAMSAAERARQEDDSDE